MTTLLDVHGLCVRYQNGALGVSDVSLSVGQAAVVALVGPNGAGKTTTVRALSGFMRSEKSRVSGAVTFNGKAIAHLEPHQIARLGVAVVPERNKVFANLTVREHLVAAIDRRVTRKGSIDEVYDVFPVLAQNLSRPAGELSGGQQQMLAIGRALVRKPSLLIIDEITLGLHPSLQPVLVRAIRRIAEQGTACLVADESAERGREMSDHVYLLQDGRTSTAQLGGDAADSRTSP